MKSLSFTYLTIAGVSAAIAAFCFYMGYLAFTGQQSGGWFFIAMGFLFGVLPSFALVRIFASKSRFFARIDKAISPEPEKTQGTHFGPHWMMMLSMIVFVLLIISVVIDVIKSLF